MAVAKSYPAKFGWRVAYFLGGLFFMAVGVAFLYLLFWRSGPNDLATAVLLLAILIPFTAFGAACAVMAIRLRLETTHTHIKYRWLFRTRSVLWSDIVGWRFTPTSPVGLVLKLKPGQPRLSIALVFEIGDEFWDRLDDAQDLEWEETVREVERISADKSLGASSEETFDNVERAGYEAKWLNGLGFALTLWAFFWPRPYAPLISTLIVYPIAILMWVRIRRGLMRLDGTNKDLIPNAAVAWLLPTLALVVRRLIDMNHLSDAWTIAVPCLLMGLLVFALMLWADPEVRKVNFTAALMLLFALTYGAGAVPLLNLVLGEAVPEDVFEVKVLDKRIHDGKILTYTAIVERLGEVDVSKQLYDQIASGQTLCCGIYNGVLNLKRIRIGACPLSPED